MDKIIEDKKRRNFLKMLMLGGGALALGKVLGNSPANLFNHTEVTTFKNFKVSENDNKFTVSSKDGQALLVIDNRA